MRMQGRGSALARIKTWQNRHHIQGKRAKLTHNHEAVISRSIAFAYNALTEVEMLQLPWFLLTYKVRSEKAAQTATSKIAHFIQGRDLSHCDVPCSLVAQMLTWCAWPNKASHSNKLTTSLLCSYEDAVPARSYCSTL